MHRRDFHHTVICVRQISSKLPCSDVTERYSGTCPGAAGPTVRNLPQRRLGQPKSREKLNLLTAALIKSASLRFVLLLAGCWMSERLGKARTAVELDEPHRRRTPAEAVFPQVAPRLQDRHTSFNPAHARTHCHFSLTTVDSRPSRH